MSENQRAFRIADLRERAEAKNIKTNTASLERHEPTPKRLRKSREESDAVSARLSELQARRASAKFPNRVLATPRDNDALKLAHQERHADLHKRTLEHIARKENN